MLQSPGTAADVHVARRHVTSPVSVLARRARVKAVTATWDGVPSATYDAPGEWEVVDLFGYQFDDDIAPLWLFVEYPHAARTAGRITAPDPRTIAGWNPAWEVDGTGPYILDVSLYRKNADGSSDSLTWQIDRSAAPDQKRSAIAARLDAARKRRELMRLR